TPTVRPDAMTCAGLLTIACGRGSELELLRKRGKSIPKKPASDLLVEVGLRYLGQRLKEMGGVIETARSRGPMRGETPLKLNARSVGDLYFLWSLERMAVVYDLGKIGGEDWYAWGVPFIL